MNGPPQRIRGVLLLYRRPLSRAFRDASTVREHIGAFAEHSRFSIHGLNTEWGFPRGLRELRFDAIVMHYSLFGHGGEDYDFDWEFRRYLDEAEDSYKVAFFQDEYMFWRRRADFLNAQEIDCVFTCLEPEQAGLVYGHHAPGVRTVSNLPGYVSDEMVSAAEQFAIPDSERTIDVGYRARPLDPWMGTDEKSEIGVRFAELAADSGLRLDIDISEKGRLYGDDWYRFMADCKTFLGVESGTRAFDLEDEVLEQYLRLKRSQREVTIDDLRGGALDRWEDRIPYRTISPRHFESAALRVCQVLFEGRYSGRMEPMVHYIPLRKDFSNLAEVIERIRDADLRRELAENAHRDLIASGENSYARLIELFDRALEEAGLGPGPPAGEIDVRAALTRGGPTRALRRLRSTLAYHPVAQSVLHPLLRPFLATYRSLRQRSRGQLSRPGTA